MFKHIRGRQDLRPLKAGIYIIFLTFGLIANGSAEDANSGDFEAWLQNLKGDARARGISDSTIDRAFRNVSPIDRVIELDRKQPEFTRTFWSYLRNRVTENRVERGRKKLDKHEALIRQVSQEYGVPPHYLVAFWGMETNFGAYLGSFPVIGSLVTLAYDERRAAFFREQLLHALDIVEAGHIEASDMHGSWAGAMGHMQFIPTTFTRHAVDASGDGQKDLWHDLHDAFASGANYLSNMGWKGDERWGREVILPENFDWTLARLDVKKSLAAWARIGVRRADSGPLPTVEGMKGSIVVPQGHDGPAFLVYDNFRVIMRWNRSISYAIAVGHLADRLVGRPKIQNGRDVPNQPLSRKQAKRLQTLLNELGHDAGKVDGLPGPQTRAAIRRFQAAAGLPQDGYPSPPLIKRLTSYAEENGES